MGAKEELYSKGLDLFDEGKNEEAIEQYKKALEEDSNDGEIYLAISIAYQQLEDFDNALEAAKKSVEFDPKEPLVYTNLSRVYVKQGMIPEAEEAMNASRHLSMGNM
jgi:Flp pilus assembly protein TadD